MNRQAGVPFSLLGRRGVQREYFGSTAAVSSAGFATGSSASLADRIASFKERETVVDTAGYLPRDARYAG